MKKKFFNVIIILFLTVSSLIFSKNLIYSDTNEMTGSYTNELKLRMSKIEKNVISKYKDVSGNDYNFRRAAQEIYDYWDKELNIIYNKLMEKLNPKAKERLIQSQKDWIEHRDDDGTFRYCIENEEGGTLGINRAISAKIRTVKERTLNLAYIYDNLND